MNGKGTARGQDGIDHASQSAGQEDAIVCHARLPKSGVLGWAGDDEESPLTFQESLGRFHGGHQWRKVFEEGRKEGLDQIDHHGTRDIDEWEGLRGFCGQGMEGLLLRAFPPFQQFDALKARIHEGLENPFGGGGGTEVREKSRRQNQNVALGRRDGTGGGGEFDGATSAGGDADVAIDAAVGEEGGASPANAQGMGGASGDASQAIAAELGDEAQGVGGHGQGFAGGEVDTEPQLAADSRGRLETEYVRVTFDVGQSETGTEAQGAGGFGGRGEARLHGYGDVGDSGTFVGNFHVEAVVEDVGSEGAAVGVDDDVEFGFVGGDDGAPGAFGIDADGFQQVFEGGGG
jgi:hypothetical protein